MDIRRGILIVVGLLALFLQPQQLDAQQNQLGKIIGNIRVVRGDFPATPILVSLEMRGSPIESAYCDGQGRFGFYNLVANEYRVSVNDEAYEPIGETVNVNPQTAPMNFLDLRLVPRETAKKDAGLKRVPGSNPYLIDPAEYNRHFPKKTIKEFRKGSDADKLGRTDAAIEHYLQCLSYSPSFYPARNNLGSAYLKQQKFSAAEEQFQAALQANKNDPQAHFNMANVLLLTQRYSDAAGQINEGLQRQPDSAFGHFLQGSLYEHTGQPALAEKSLRDALNLDPLMSQAYLQLVNLYLQQKRTPEAIAELRAYIKAFPNSTFSEKAQSLLQNLQQQQAGSPQ
jgi:tetratricopeptide (TPR) repeat protein